MIDRRIDHAKIVLWVPSRMNGKSVIAEFLMICHGTFHLDCYLYLRRFLKAGSAYASSANLQILPSVWVLWNIFKQW